MCVEGSLVDDVVAGGRVRARARGRDAAALVIGERGAADSSPRSCGARGPAVIGSASVEESGQIPAGCCPDPTRLADPADPAASAFAAAMEAADGTPSDHHHAYKKVRANIAVARKHLAKRLSGSPRASPEHELDMLARVTAKFNELLQRLGAVRDSCQRSHYYSVLSRTTQPAHLVTFIAVALVAALLFPRHGLGAATPNRPPSDADPAPWTHLAYVVSFAAHFGSQFWMTFVSGLSLFFCLPRHHFAEVQKVLFPLYFAINATFSLVTLATFVRLQPSTGSWTAPWDAEACVQVGSMVLCFLMELLVRLYLTPPLLQLITVKTEMEKTVEGVGQEVGRYDLGPLTQCPHYVKIHRAFRKVHVTIAMVNIATMGCTALHAHYLAGKICI